CFRSRALRGSWCLRRVAGRLRLVRCFLLIALRRERRRRRLVEHDQIDAARRRARRTAKVEPEALAGVGACDEKGSFRNLRGSQEIRVVREAACGGSWAWAACSAAG